MTTPFLEIRDLEILFGRPGAYLRAVDGVSLHVNPGERVGIVGQSGSGKSQTVSSILGLDRGYPGVVGGEIVVDGLRPLDGLADFVQRRGDPVESLEVRKDVVGWRKRQAQVLRQIRGSRVGMVFQQPRTSLIPYQTVERHLRETARSLGMEVARGMARGEELLRRLGFTEPRRILASHPHEMSGGECQRVMLALAMVGEPGLLVADEPTTALDPLIQGGVLELLGEMVAEQGAALLLISHDIGLIRFLCSRTLVMYRGRICEDGPTEALFTAQEGQRHPYTNRLLSLADHAEAATRDIEGESGPEEGASSAGLEVGPEGCPFAPRCALRSTLPQEVQDQCWNERPPAIALGPQRRAYCWGLSQEGPA